MMLESVLFNGDSILDSAHLVVGVDLEALSHRPGWWLSREGWATTTLYTNDNVLNRV